MPGACHDHLMETQQPDDLDFAVAAWREEGRWNVSALPLRTAADIESLRAALRQLPGEGGVFGIVGVLDEFFLIVRQSGEHSRMFVSDGTAILDFALVEDAADLAGLPVDEDELEEFMPAGDATILADFGVDETELRLLCEDDSLYPDEQLAAIAKRLGIGDQWSRALASR